MTKDNGLLWMTFVVLGVFLGMFTVSKVDNVFGSDFARIKTIVRVLKDEVNHSPDIVFFGNSILMSAINARQIMEETYANDVIYNLSSSGQSFVEGSLLLQHIRPPIKKVYHFVSFSEMTKLGQPSDQVLRNFKYSGFDLSRETEGRLRNIDLDYFDKSIIELSIDHRGALRDGVNRSFRTLLRKDLKLEGKSEELFYPNTYTKRLGNKKYNSLVERFRIENFKSSTLDDEFIDVVLSNQHFLKEKEIEYILVISPINPDILNFSQQEMKDKLKTLDDSEITFIDVTKSLESSYFIDHYHPTPEGAKILSNIFSNILNVNSR